MLIVLGGLPGTGTATLSIVEAVDKVIKHVSKTPMHT